MNDEEAGVSSKTASPRSAFSRLGLGMEFAKTTDIDQRMNGMDFTQ